MKYNPENEAHRRELARLMINRLEGRGYAKRETPQGQEEQYAKSCGSWNTKSGRVRVQVRVYTSIVQAQDGSPIVRALAKDAIRVCLVALATTGMERGLASETRVFRTGAIEDIVARMLDRGYELQERVPAIEVCKDCGSPLFTSKKGNLVCVEACWTRKEGTLQRQEAGGVKRRTVWTPE